MFEIEETSVYSLWLRSLRDRTGRTRITARIVRLQAGNFGDSKPVGAGIYELRMTFGPGYRVYYARQGERISCCCAAATRAAKAATLPAPSN